VQVKYLGEEGAATPIGAAAALWYVQLSSHPVGNASDWMPVVI